MTALTTEAAHARICAVERERDLLRHQIDGWSVWPLLRHEVGHLLTGVSFGGRSAMSRGQRLALAAGSLPRLAFARRARHLVKTYSSGLLEQTGDRFKDIWFDDLILAIGSAFKLELINNARFLERRERALVPSDATTNALEFAGAFLRRTRRAPRAIADISNAIATVLRNDLGLDGVTAAWVFERIEWFHWMKPVYAMLLRRVRPEAVLVADPGEHALVAAAKEAGCTTIEVQHGINDRSHSGYMWTDYALPFKAAMPVSDRFFLYGEHWRRELASGGFWGDSLRVVGSSRLDSYRERAARDEGRETRVLVTTQGFETDRVAAFVVEAQRHCDVPVRITIRMHPVMEQSKEPYLSRGLTDVLAGDEGPSTFDLLRRSDLHVSISSACHYDAIGLGVPTAILPLTLHEIVLPLHAAGHAHLARTPADLAAIIRDARGNRVAPEVSEYYFRSGALENMRAELESAVRERSA